MNQAMSPSGEDGNGITLLLGRQWQFALGESVRVDGATRTGVVVARTEHIDTREEYLVRFVSSDGFVSRAWLQGFDLHSAEVSAAVH